ncbi:PREDICTED: aldehyde dehydrogenase family 8 member A1 isoform X1 [Condylura cristata]|uniref:aldehyde dehydrogenase family 8 member A1 isoform X1 n=1 Tax=Condylura cristata TaxID=143302 RepID=UPI00033479F6|nr:PREDICTED: aldehyde dehydrogenase family 8 member A1 isoform X1 [Condylura cristata]
MAGTKELLVLNNFIGGKFLPCNSYIDSYDPSTGEVYCRVPNSGKDEVEAAVKAATAAFPAWSSRSPQERSQVLQRLADLLEQSLEEFAKAESKDQGKTITMAKTVDIPRSVHNFRFFASSILHHTSECTQMDHMGCMHYTVRMPVGIAGLISPWNLPLYLLTWKIAPAIAAGNTVIAKPSELTSVTAWMMCQLLGKAGVPPGVVNIVFGTGPGVGEALVSHPEVPLISFTGSQPTAERITQLSAPYCKKLSLELGGKNPAIIFEDAKLEECISNTVRSSFANQGEICLCTSRIFVQKSIYSEFLKRFVEASRMWKVGIPSDPSASMGALISKAHLEKVRSYIKKARTEGAQVLCGEGVDVLSLPARNQAGYFMLPTVITDIKDESPCMKEEIFGPVTCVVPFDSEEEVIKRANNVKYGLAATVWSSDVGRVHRVAKKLQAGLVWTNCWLIRELNLPFGGMKSSGVGREGAKDSYEFFTEVKTITVKH